jgi:hypothetical protein
VVCFQSVDGFVLQRGRLSWTFGRGDMGTLSDACDGQILPDMPVSWHGVGMATRGALSACCGQGRSVDALHAYLPIPTQAAYYITFVIFVKEKMRAPLRP